MRRGTTILAIDPGNESSGFILWDAPRRRALDFGWLGNRQLRYAILGGEFRLAGHVAIEMVACYGMPVGREVFDTCRWIGRFEEALEIQHMPPAQLVERQRVKMMLCNSVRATDANIRQALIDRIGPVGTKAKPGPLYGITSHVMAALAVAEYAAAFPS